MLTERRLSPDNRGPDRRERGRVASRRAGIGGSRAPLNFYRNFFRTGCRPPTPTKVVHHLSDEVLTTRLVDRGGPPVASEVGPGT